MRKLKLQMQVSLDGFTADASGGTDWMVWGWSSDWKWDEKLRKYSDALMTSSDCILLSRKMAEEGFHGHWERTAADRSSPAAEYARLVNETPKIVFSRTLKQSAWKNTRLSGKDYIAEINNLKSGEGKDIIVFGGPTLASSLVEANLIDEFHIVFNPVMIGKGRSMFGGLDAQRQLQFVDATICDCGVMVVKYIRRD